MPRLSIALVRKQFDSSIVTFSKESYVGVFHISSYDHHNGYLYTATKAYLRPPSSHELSFRWQNYYQSSEEHEREATKTSSFPSCYFIINWNVNLKIKIPKQFAKHAFGRFNQKRKILQTYRKSSDHLELNYKTLGNCLKSKNHPATFGFFNLS